MKSKESEHEPNNFQLFEYKLVSQECGTNFALNSVKNNSNILHISKHFRKINFKYTNELYISFTQL